MAKALPQNEIYGECGTEELMLKNFLVLQEQREVWIMFHTLYDFI